MSGYLGIDTSNYTTSCAIYRMGRIVQEKRLLPVPQGQLGLRQSDAVFSHTKVLGELMTALREKDAQPLSGIGVSIRPRDVEGSYMPCFLVGKAAAQTASAAMGVSLHTVSHQAGHIAAALYGAGRLELADKSFLAFHLSGGTTECLWVRDLKHADIECIAATRDLNAGQVVDRVGGMLGLPFPAGAYLDPLAHKSGKQFKIKPSIQEGCPSLSGIENQCQKRVNDGEAPEDVARFCIESIRVALVHMAQWAKERTGCTDLLFAGGVMSNSIIRTSLEELLGGIFSPREFSCDNAAGVAILTAMHAGERVFREDVV